MKLPEYITADEVKRVCTEIGLRDWSQITDPVVSEEEAATILNIVNIKGMDIPLKTLQKGLEVELEHGTRFDDANEGEGDFYLVRNNCFNWNAGRKRGC